jgi:hypothetical protein
MPKVMLTFQDCIDLAGVTEAEIEAIAKHERIPAMIALELADHMLHTPAKAVNLRDFIVENLRRAQGRNNCTDCAKLGRLLAGYLDTHPDCRECEIDRARQMAEVIAIGLVEQILARAEEMPQDAQAVLRGIDDAKRRRDCAACGVYCLRLLDSLER